MRDIETQVLSQSHMETWFQKRLAPDFPRFQGVIGRMRPRLLCCDYEAKESIMAYDVLDWNQICWGICKMVSLPQVLILVWVCFVIIMPHRIY